MYEAPLDPPAGDDDGPDSEGGAFFGVSRDVGPPDDEPVVEGCDHGLTATDHAKGVGALYECSCYLNRLAARRDRKVA